MSDILAAPVFKPLERLTEKQRAFVLAFIGEAEGNAAKAARMAGYAEASASVTGCKLIKVPSVRHAIDRLRPKSEHVKAQQRASGRFEKLVEAIDREGPANALASDGAPSREHAIKWLELAYRGEVTETRTTRFGDPYEATPALAPRVRALEVLAKLEGWAPAEMPAPGSKDNPLHVASAAEEDYSGMSLDQLRARKAELEAQRAARLGTPPPPPAVPEPAN